MEKISMKINGREIATVAGKTILEVVRENKLDDIPTLCHSDELEPFGSCFVCVVEVKGRPNLVPSCSTRVAAGMEVETRNERIVASRKTAFELLMSNHYADCVSPCMEGCPAGVDAQGYIALSAMGEYRKAVDLIRESNPLPAVCGRVCVRKCEVVCRRQDVDSPVGINAVKRFVTDSPGAYDGAAECAPPTGKSVGIVGAGPAGLTAAWFLGRKGHKAVLYEAKARSGGMIRYGIPEYRLPDAVLDAEVAYICKTGAEINYNVRVGEDIALEQLKKKHDAIFLAAGAWTGKPMMVEGEKDTPGVVTGADFLPARTDDREPVSGTVVVVGGGNTAMDVARTSWRLGADKVIILYRRTRDEMPADRMEIEDCLDEGIEIMELAAPIGIIAEKGRLKALRCQRMKLGEPDASGRRRPVPLEGSEFDLPCNLAVSAIGQGPVLDGLTEIGGAKLKLTRWDTISIDTATCATSVDGVFAGGDAADDGPTVVIDAIRDGQRAAASIDAWLRGAETERKPFTVKKEFWAKPGKAELGEIKESPRHEVHLIDVEERKNSFREVSTGFDFEDNAHECARCLSCGCVRFDDCTLRLYAQEYGVDMDHFKGYVRKHRIDDRHPYIIYDPNKCVLCARCIRTCARVLPISAIGLVGRGFRTEMRPAMNDPLVETNCVSCGNCVDSCPTAALTVKYPFPGRSCIDSEDVVTNCAFCSLACSIKVRKFGEDRYYIASSGAPGKYLCRYGRFGNELFIKQDRIKTAAIRGGGARAGATLEEACGAVVAGLRGAAEKYGAGKVGVFISPDCTNEEMYLASRIAREGIGTNNVASLSILCAGRESGVLDESFGFTASTADRSCMADADLFICNNTAMESDHLVLAAEMLQSVRKGAGLIVTNSTLDPADQFLSTLAMDPMRGRAAVLWNGIIRVLMNEGYFGEKLIKSIEGSGEFLSGMDISLEEAEELSGIGRDRMEKAASIIREAERIVIIHGPDRPQDQASGDMKVFANLVALLRAAGKRADLLLPRLISNSAGLEVTGADPAFTAGRIPAGDSFKGARSHKELRGLLEAGEIRAALIIGEDPMAWGRTGAWFGNVEFMAAMDWTDTETTRFANVVLPGSTFLETNGTRCNFEGRVARFIRAVEPPAGVCSVEALRTLANGFGIKTDGDIAAELDSVVAKGLGKLVCHYWNKGEAREGGGGRLVAPGGGIKAGAIDPPLTHSGKYRKEIREVGTDRFRVRQ